MWYSDKINKELDLNRPIIAESKEGAKQLLLPQIENKSYIVIGYNWFNLTEGMKIREGTLREGTYGSSATWKTPQEAIYSRKKDGWDVYNVTINIVKDGE